jgi:chromosome segregation ATPase
MQDRSERRQVEALANAVKAIEDQQRDQKAIVAKLAMQEERLNSQFDTIVNRLESLTFGQETLNAHVKINADQQDLIHLLRDQIAALIDRQKIVESRVEDFGKQRLSTLERERVDRDGALRRLDSAEKTTQKWEERITVVEEIARRMQESSALAGQKLDRLDQSMEGIGNRGGRNLEAAKRLETELRQVESIVDTLQRQDDTVLERVQLLNEVVRRVEDKIALLSSQEARYQEVIDKIELQRVERLRVEELLNRADRALDEHKSLIDHLSHVTATIEGRYKGLSERVEYILSETERFHGDIAGQIHRFTQVQERQKRRQIQDLETEIRDMKRHVIVGAPDGHEQQPPQG